MTNETSKVEVIFDGVQGFHATYGFSSLDCDAAAMGYGHTYAEAIEDALDQLYEALDGRVDLSYNTDESDEIEAAAAAAAIEQGIDVDSNADVAELCEEMQAEGMNDDEIAAEMPAVAVVVRLHKFLK